MTNGDLEGRDLEIDGFRLECTCFVCPEQYSVFYAGDQVAYLRLRHGRFTVECPDVGGELVYLSYTKGDGCFDDRERLPELKRAIAAISKFTHGGKSDVDTEMV